MTTAYNPIPAATLAAVFMRLPERPQWFKRSSLNGGNGIDDAIQAVNRYEELWGEGAGSRAFRAALRSPWSGFFSVSPRGHMTGSAVIVRADGRFLLGLHKRFGTWQQLGGHADGETHPARVALREASEESGLKDLVILPWPIDIDVHPVHCPNGQASRHFDVCYLVAAIGDTAATSTDESAAIRWCDLELARSLGASDRVIRMAAISEALAKRLPVTVV